jgi:hypothetical protein
VGGEKISLLQQVLCERGDSNPSQDGDEIFKDQGTGFRVQGAGVRASRFLPSQDHAGSRDAATCLPIKLYSLNPTLPKPSAFFHIAGEIRDSRHYWCFIATLSSLNPTLSKP